MTVPALQADVRVPKPFVSSSEKTAYEADVLVQLKSNLAQLEDLHGRMRFLMGELSYLLLKRS
jgi:hypothetical protein